MHRRCLWSASLAVAILLAQTAAAGSLVEVPDLVSAAKNGDATLARNALLRGDDPDIVDDDGLTPLLYAIKDNHPEITAQLLKGHASANKVGPDGKSPLWWASVQGDAETIDALVKAGAKVDNGSKGGITPLMGAAAAGQDDAVVALLADGADVGRTDYSGRDALSWAEDSHNPRVVAILKAAQKH